MFSSPTPSLVAETPTPVPSPTATAIPCDPSTADYCLLEGHFLLRPPVTGVLPDQHYLYGTTENSTRDPHHGLEFPAAVGTPVLAAADGTVVFAGQGAQNQRYGPPLWSDRGFYGNLIVLSHQLPGVDGPIYTLYAHLSSVAVQAGQQVLEGERIGLVGVTGSAVGAHLHFEVRQGGDTYADNRNPILWLRFADGQAVLAGRILDARGEPVYVDGELQALVTPPDGVCVPGLARVPEQTKYPLLAYDRRNDGRFPVGLDPAWQETFALGGLPPGCYRVVYFGGELERVVMLKDGLLTMLILR